jgi:uncharacterized protein YdhG (YjbR/CyaY superfamily)
MKTTSVKNVDDYIEGFPPAIQEVLTTLRSTIRKAAPKAEETIKYDMPTFTLHGNLIHFAAYKNHVGIYPVPRTVDEFKKPLAAYEGNKSTLKIPFGEPLPLALITKIVKYLVARNSEKTKAKSKH